MMDATPVPVHTEKKSAAPGLFRAGVGLRFKITLTFFIINMVVSGLLAFSSYLLLKNILTHELFRKLDDITRLGSVLIDPPALRELAARARTDLTPEQVNAAERSAAFVKISDSLNAVRNVEKRLVRYVYTFIPTADPDRAIFLVDADLIALKRSGTGDMTRFGSTFDLTNFAKAREAILSDQPTVDDTFVRDEEFKVNSVSGYAPIRDAAGKVVAYIGVDMADTDVQAALADVSFTFSLVAAAALALTFIAAVILGTLFTRSKIGRAHV
jgi:hypothetical protein